MADVGLDLHAVEALEQVVARGGVQLIELVDHAGVLVALAVEQRRAEGVDLDLQVHELLEVLVEARGLGSHLLGERDTGDLGGDERPTALVDLGDLEGLGRADAALVDAGEVQGLVEDVGDGLRLVEDLDDLVAEVVDDLVAAAGDLYLGVRKNHGVTFLSGCGARRSRRHHCSGSGARRALGAVSGAPRAANEGSESGRYAS